MIDTIYIEHDVADHPRVAAILERFPAATRIPCRRYGEVFNRRAQNFRLQKRRPALILARRHDGHVQDSPEICGPMPLRSCYFSHVLNCPYDCRYCFLQGMFQSAHYVLFVNWEDFETAIRQRLAATSEATLFCSGYDGDSLALDGVTGFVGHFVPFFDTLDDAWLELRTKSVAIRALLALEARPRVLVAYSLAPERVARAVEHGAPPLAARIAALRRLAEGGWPVGLRFDPLILHDGWRDSYEQLFQQVFEALPGDTVHSVTLGALRFPAPVFERIERLHPDAALLAGPLERRAGEVSYRHDLELEMDSWCRVRLAERIDDGRIFSALAPAAPAAAAGIPETP